MRSRFQLLSVALLALAATPAFAGSVNGGGNAGARAACGKALARGDLDALRIAWTIWQSREVSQTVEIKHGKLARYGGLSRNARTERALDDGERKALLAALRSARVDHLVWIDRDVKNDNDRVLNVDVIKPDGSVDPVGAFVRSGGIWHAGTTAQLAALLEKWLAPDGK